MTKSEYHEWLLNTTVNPDKVMLEYWGERCEKYVEECCACRAWKHYDETKEVME